jgi:hypothetical protein
LLIGLFIGIFPSLLLVFRRRHLTPYFFIIDHFHPTRWGGVVNDEKKKFAGLSAAASSRN